MKEEIKGLAKVALIFTVLSLFVISHSGFAQDKASKIDELMKLYNDYGQFNGSVLVAENEKVICKKGFGLANMEWNIPNQPDTKFRIGSMTKQFTSMVIMQLVEREKLRLDDKVTDHLPNYPKETGDQITIHHLLTHTSGIPEMLRLPDFISKKIRDPHTPDELVGLFSDLGLGFEPGTKFSYSNSNYILLGAIIEKITGKSYEDVLQENILEPLKMYNTGYEHHNTIIDKRAAGYIKTFNGYENAPCWDLSNAYSVGAMYSTVEDLYLWDQALYAEKLLSKEYTDIMFKPCLNNYAYGWRVIKVQIGTTRDSTMAIRHDGSSPGFNALIVRLVDDEHLIILLDNTGITQKEIRETNCGIRNILYDKPYDLPEKP